MTTTQSITLPAPEIPAQPEKPEFIPDIPVKPNIPVLPEINPETDPQPAQRPVELPPLAEPRSSKQYTVLFSPPKRE